jgi:hypothetical protein
MMTATKTTVTTEELHAQIAKAEAQRDRHSRDARTAWKRYAWHKRWADRAADEVGRLRKLAMLERLDNAGEL